MSAAPWGPVPEAVVASGTGRAFRLAAGAAVEIIALEGPQVADMWAFTAADPGEFLSTEHTRSCLDRLCPRVGEAFYSNRRRPILTILADSSPGVHDLLLSACDEARYRLLGHTGPHRSCVANLRAALAAFDIAPPHLPSPVNIFENVIVTPDGRLEITPPHVAAGEALTLRAEMELLLVVSACPMDMVPTNGADLRPKPILVRQARPAATGA